MSGLDVHRAAHNFSLAAGSYDQAAQLQQQTREHLLAWLTADERPETIVDLGCGTGLALPALHERAPQAQLIALDRAEGMVRRARRFGSQALQADAASLPLAAQSCDLLFSNLVLQWCPQPERALAEAARVLRPRGRLLISVPGPNTLQELRRAWRQIDDAEHVHRFASAAQWRQWAAAAGLRLDTAEARLIPIRHRTVRELMQGLRDIGARNASAARRRGLAARDTLQRLEAAYPAREADGGVLASWDILYFAWRRG